MIPSLLSKLRRYAPAGALVVGAVATVGFVRSRPVDVSTVAVDRGPVVREAIGSGTLESEAVVEVAFTIAGRVTEVRFHEGDRVRAGEVLAALDAEQESHRVAMAQRNVALASHGAERSAAEVARAEAVVAAARTELDRTEALFATGATPTAALDSARERLARAEAELAAATAARRQGASGLAAARAGLALDATRSEEAVVRSPFDGIVVRRHHEPGDVLAPGEVALTVASTQKVWARTWLDETVLHELREGQEASVVPRGDTSRRYRARVDRIAVEADRETHEVLVDLELLERPARLVFGQRVDGFVVLERREAAVRAPRGACDEPSARCYLARGGRVAAIDVRLGLRGTDFVEVERGLRPGDRLVLPREDGAPVPVGRSIRSVER